MQTPSLLSTYFTHDTGEIAVDLSVHQLAESLGTAIDAKDSNTCRHSEEVAVIAQSLGATLGVSSHYANILHIAGHLHDIGKIGIPDKVLQKKGPLTDDEYAIIKLHPVIGANIVSPVSTLVEIGIREMVLHHHERFDGTGYPSGLAENDIPYGARIIAVADSLSAMMQDRPYRKAMSFENCLVELQNFSGSQFDPLVVDALVSSDKEIGGLMRSLKKKKTELHALAV